MKKITTLWMLPAMALALLFQGVPMAHASQVDLLIEKLVEKKILTRLDAESLRSEIETAEKKDFKAQLKSSNAWLDGLTSKGDVRLRYEAFNRESEDNRTTTGATGGTDRNRFRFRVRWGLEKKFNDEWKAGFRLATGSGTTDATSTNQSFDGEFGLKSVFLDQAYATFTPTKRVQQWVPATDLVEIGAGKVANPYSDWATTIIWDGDVTPEGIYEKWDFNLMNGENENYLKLHTLMGQWVLDEDSDQSPGDMEMMSYGVGATYQWAKGHKTSFKFTYYDWQDYAQFLKSSSSLANALGGSDREVDDFKVINFYADVDFDAPTAFFGVQPFKIYGDFAHNTDAGNPTGSSSDESSVNPALRDGEDNAFSIGINMGKPKEVGEWGIGYEYLYIEANATPGVFTESDLGVGHNNNHGHKLSYKYMIFKNVELNLTAWIVEKINKTIITYQASDLRVAGDDDQIFRTQADIVYKF